MDIEQIKNIKLNFILATARTGSTLLSFMLNMHPNILATIEEPFAYNLYPKYSKIKVWTSEIIQEYCDDFFLFLVGKFDAQLSTKTDLQSILEGHKMHLNFQFAIRLTYLCFFPDKEKNEITTIVDKQLTFHYVLKKVARYYPESKFIILHRDPRDNAAAKYNRFNQIYNYTDYYKISCVWNYIYKRLLKLKNKINNNRFLEIKYEDLITNPEKELKKICLFLNIPYQSSMLLYDEKMKVDKEHYKKKLNTESQERFETMHTGLTQKVNVNKIGLYKQQLKKEDSDLIWTICGQLAKKIGYKKDDDFVPVKIKWKDYLAYLNIIRDRPIIFLYHESPFWIRRWIKKYKNKRKIKISFYCI